MLTQQQIETYQHDGVVLVEDVAAVEAALLRARGGLNAVAR